MAVLQLSSIYEPQQFFIISIFSSVAKGRPFCETPAWVVTDNFVGLQSSA